MGFWPFVLGAVALVVFSGVFWLATRFRKFGFIDRLSRGSRFRGFLLGLLIVAVITAAAYLALGYMNAAIVVIHLTLIWALCDLAALIVRRIRKKTLRRYWPGAAAIAITVVYLGVGMYQAYGVWEKNYTLTTDKQIGSVRVAMIADSHTGTTFDGEGFAEHMKELQKASPDLLVIAGDFVDDDTTREDMLRCCDALGELQTTYGVFYSFGNHDRGYFNYRNFSADELLGALRANGVNVLADDVVPVGDDLYVIGREDKSSRGRAPIGELTQGLDEARYKIVIDHQPADYAAEAAAGADLVLSGHTHGGQLYILNWIMELMHTNDMLYGHRHTDGTDFVVTSGISDWNIVFKTGCRSEYVIIDISHE